MKNYRQNHDWSADEDYICCEEYLIYSLRDNTIKDFHPLLDALSLKLKEISKNSIYKKLRNICYLCSKYKIPNFIDIAYHEHFSEQNEIVFNMALLHSDIQKLITCRKAELQSLKKQLNQNSINDVRNAIKNFQNNNK